MRDRNATPTAVVVSAVLHLGIVGFLFLAMLPCASYEGFFQALHLPRWLNPITCSTPLQLQGPIIEATLMGPTGSPPPKASKAKPVPHAVPPPPSVPPPTPPPTPAPKLKTLPPPPEHPDVKDQERVVEQGLQQAEEQRVQKERERQHQAELDAQAAKRKAEMEKVNELFAKLDAASARTKTLDSQARRQQADLKKAQDDGQADLPNAAQRQSGTNSADSSLSDRYAAAIQNAVTPNWLRPDNMPNVPCKVHIVQLPGGDVMSATVDPSCPYDEAGKRSIENAVLRTKTLPYKGFEKVFSRDITLTFMPQ